MNTVSKDKPKSGPRLKRTAAMRAPSLKSLFIVSLPRSLSSLVYGFIQHSMGLKEPRWTKSGEILNFDRFFLLPRTPVDFGRKFTAEDSEPKLFQSITEFLDHLFVARGYIYKDVVQPYVVSSWIRHRGVLAVRIKRAVPDVAYSMIERGWHYPSRRFAEESNRDLALVRGLVRAERILDTIPAPQLDFDDIIASEEPIHSALNKLYGNVSIKRLRYIDEDFKKMRHNILVRRESNKYNRLVEYAAMVREHP